jgi:hypothetical protein
VVRMRVEALTKENAKTAISTKKKSIQYKRILNLR